jgi:putative PIN family toxin of toxin-antitoxin system
MSRIRVFLDTNVLASYLLGEPEARRLFDRNITKRVQYIISPIVLQELLLISDELAKKERPDEISRLLSKYLTVKELDEDTLKASAERIKQLRNRLMHANDLINIQVAATTADFFVTQDKQLLGLKRVDSVEVISPERFFDLLEQAA